MGSRIELHNLLVGLIPSGKVYFQPPETVKLTYPCIIYKRSTNHTFHADDAPYLIKKKYDILVIDKDPDTIIPDKVAMLPLTSPSSPYTFDNLYHYPFSIYF